MFDNVTALKGLHVTGKYRDRSMQRTILLKSEYGTHETVKAKFWP